MHVIIQILMTEAHRRIEEKLAYHLKCIEELKSEWNKLAPISILPIEILSAIFCFASAGRTSTLSLFPCYNFTHVSRSWRSVALNTPNLWQVLPKSVPWATIMLERSKGADLVVEEDFQHLSPDSSRVLFLKEVFANHASRIRELHLFWFDTRIADILFENVPQSSLRPRSLILRRTSTYTGPYTFPTGIIGTENLRILDVQRCAGPWYSLSLPALTKFLEMLTGLAATLNVLHIDDLLPLANAPVCGMDPVNLPNLRHLCLASTCNPKEITSLLSFIIVPRTATLELYIESSPPTTIQLEIILVELASSFSTFFGHLRQGTHFSYRSLYVWSWWCGQLELQAWKDFGRMTLMLDLKSRFTPSTAQDFLQRIFPSLPLFSITSLTSNISPVRRLLEETFGHLSCLKDIIAIGDCAAELIPVLAHRPENSNKPSGFLFPALECLCIARARCTIQELLDSLMERCQRKGPLLKLKLTDCDVAVECMEGLREVVNDVEWDLDGKE